MLNGRVGPQLTSLMRLLTALRMVTRVNHQDMKRTLSTRAALAARLLLLCGGIATHLLCAAGEMNPPRDFNDVEKIITSSIDAWTPKDKAGVNTKPPPKNLQAWLFEVFSRELLCSWSCAMEFCATGDCAFLVAQFDINSWELGLEDMYGPEDEQVKAAVATVQTAARALFLSAKT